MRSPALHPSTRRLQNLVFIWSRHLSSLAILIAMVLAGCDSTDMSEPELDHIVLSVIPNGPSGTIDTATIDVSGTTPIALDTLVLTNGASYTGEVKFFDADNNVIRTFVPRVEEIRSFYDLESIEGIDLETTDFESTYARNDFGQDFPVGFKFDITVELLPQARSGTLRYRFADFESGTKTASSPSPSAVQIDATVPVRVVPLPRPSEFLGTITRAKLSIVRLEGGIPPKTIEFMNPSGLQDGQSGPEPSLKIDSTGTYRVTIELFESTGTKDLQQILDDHSDDFEFSPTLFSNSRILEDLSTDVNGKDYGRTFTFRLRRGSAGFLTGVIELFSYDPNLQQTKAAEDGTKLIELMMRLEWDLQ